jgi:exonuclease SbcC
VRITRIELRNCRRLARFERDFAPGTVLLLGPNESGKTSVVMAIGWAMFDSLPCKKADFIHRGAKEAWAKVTFEHAGEEYWVGRSTKDGASLRKENGQVLAMGTRDTYSHLSALLGLNGDLSSLYRDALAPPQGQLTAGFSLSPAGTLESVGRTTPRCYPRGHSGKGFS